MIADPKHPAPSLRRREVCDSAQAEAEVRAHDRVSPDAMLDSIAAVNLYVEAFVAGAKFAAASRGNGATGSGAGQ